MSITPIEEWFPDYVRTHRTYYSTGWPKEETEEYDLYLARFMKAFADRGVTQAEAIQALDLLVEDPPRYRADHLAKVLKVVREIKKRDAKEAKVAAPIDVSPEQLAAVEVSRGCPECSASGYAARDAMSRATTIPFRVKLFCRCPIGRFRRLEDKSRDKGDLQALPALWNRSLDHPTWRGQAIPNLLRNEPTYRRFWWFVGDEPDDVASIRGPERTVRSGSRRKLEPAESREATDVERQVAERRRAQLLGSLTRRLDGMEKQR